MFNILLKSEELRQQALAQLWLDTYSRCRAAAVALPEVVLGSRDEWAAQKADEAAKQIHSRLYGRQK
jgi:hypothetical protein